MTKRTKRRTGRIKIRSINKSIKRSIKKSIKRPIKRSIKRDLVKSLRKTIERSIKKSLNKFKRINKKHKNGCEKKKKIQRGGSGRYDDYPTELGKLESEVHKRIKSGVWKCIPHRAGEAGE